MWANNILLAAFPLCTLLVTAAPLDDAVCSKILHGSTAKYNPDGEFIGCVHPSQNTEISHDGENNSSGHSSEYEESEYLNSQTSPREPCPSNMVHGWDADKETFTCLPLANNAPPINNQGPGMSQPELSGAETGTATSEPTCPEDGGYFEVVDGVVYKLLCYQGHGTRTPILRRIDDVWSASECLELCSADRRCTAANYWWRTGECTLAKGKVFLGPYRTRDRVLGAIVKGYTRPYL